MRTRINKLVGWAAGVMLLMLASMPAVSLADPPDPTDPYGCNIVNGACIDIELKCAMAGTYYGCNPTGGCWCDPLYYYR